MRWSRLLLLTGPVFLAAALIKASNVVSGSQPMLPLCPPVRSEASGEAVNANLLLVSTLDGQITALDMDRSGEHLWSVATGPGPMLSSTISQVSIPYNFLSSLHTLWKLRVFVSKKYLQPSQIFATRPIM
jgi:hypothetical protein